MIESDAVVDTDAPSVTLTVKLLVPAAVGVPDIVAPLRLNPAGSDPLAIDHVYGAVPPLAVSVAAYAVPTVPLSSAVVVIFSVAGFTVIERSAVAVTDALSVAFTVKLLVPAALGVPVMVEPLSVSPAGSDPLTIVHVYGAVPPDAVSVCW